MGDVEVNVCVLTGNLVYTVNFFHNIIGWGGGGRVVIQRDPKNKSVRSQNDIYSTSVQSLCYFYFQ